MDTLVNDVRSRLEPTMLTEDEGVHGGLVVSPAIGQGGFQRDVDGLKLDPRHRNLVILLGGWEAPGRNSRGDGLQAELGGVHPDVRLSASRVHARANSEVDREIARRPHLHLAVHFCPTFTH